MRRRLAATLNEVAYPTLTATLTVVGYAIRRFDGGALLRWIREVPEDQIVA